MSSKYVREKVKTFLGANSSEKVVDLTGEFDTLQDLLTREGITHKDNWVGLQFIGNDEVPVGLNAGNSDGKYREMGAVYIHVVAQAKLGVMSSILDRAEVLRNTIRGQRIEDLIVDSITPPNFSDGGTISFEGGYTSCSIILNYTRDVKL